MNRNKQRQYLTEISFYDRETKKKRGQLTVEQGEKFVIIDQFYYVITDTYIKVEAK